MSGTPLAPARRLGLVALTWGLIGLAQPGVLRPDGLWPLALLAIGPWAYAAHRPGRRAFLAEWAGHALGLAGVFAWMLEFMPAVLLPMSAVPALYPALAGVLLRRAARAPLALLAPAAWVLAEAVRWSLPVPLSFGWFRLGMLLHDASWVVGSAAWFGTWGLSWALAALGGLAADVANAVRAGSLASTRTAAAALLGLGPVGALAALDATAAPPRTVDGPDLLVVQSGIEQEIKAARRDSFYDLFVPQVTRTLQAIHGTRPAGATGDDAFPDVVLWGETFLPGKLADEPTREAIVRGVRPAPWAPAAQLDAPGLLSGDLSARDLVSALLGTRPLRVLGPAFWDRAFRTEGGAEWADRVARGEALLPPGTSFLSGVEAWTVVDGPEGEELRSVNGVSLWSPDGFQSPVASKVHLVPGGETGAPLRFFPFVLDAIRRVASAVPDFVVPDEQGVLALPGRDGRAFRAGIAVCYDNAFDDVFAAPLRRGPVDLFLVVSNEAWYGASAEMDHMLAFARIAAAAARRAIVRATNSGISCVVGPDGEVRALVTDADGRRKMISGAMRATVPVPAPDAAAPPTLFVRTEPLQPLAWGGLAGLLLLAAVALRARTAGGAPAEPDSPDPGGNRGGASA
ncbi:MAG: nitrilase-related carbon-nitrogen hydrolase [Planctomycetota bacterium]